MLSDPIVEIQNQILGQAVRIVGTFSLHYRSDRVPGRKAAYGMTIPLSRESVPHGLKAIEVEVEVAGRRFAQGFEPAPRQSYTFTWDGRDADGRPVQGKQAVRVRVSYTYRASWPRPELTRWREWTRALGVWDARTYGMGGWTLGVHHFYDRVGRVLYLGDGGRRSNVAAALTPSNGPKAHAGHGGLVGEYIIPAESGLELYVFDGAGRHRRTLHALLGGLLWRFEYDGAGRLAAVEDGDGKVTRVEPDTQGSALAIVGPYGQRTDFSIDADGYLANATNPAGHAVHLYYADGGLLASVTDPNGNVYRFRYDDQGRLLRSEDPAGGGYHLLASCTETSTTVALITAMGREFRYSTERLPDGRERRVNKCCGGVQTITLVRGDGTRTISYADGTTVSERSRSKGDQPVGSSLRDNISISTPGGLAATVSRDVRVDLATRHATAAVTRQTESGRINGRAYTREIDVPQKRIVIRTPAGRNIETTVDDAGRPLILAMLGLFPMEFHYNGQGRLTRLIWGSTTEKRLATASYDSNASVSIMDSLGRVWRFEYDEAGLTTRLISPDGQKTEFKYDANHNPTSMSPPGRPAHRFEYTPANLMRSYDPPGTEPNGTTYDYSQDKQLSRITRADGTIIEFQYDEASHLTGISFQKREVRRFAYNLRSRNLTSIATPDGNSLSYEYDGALLTRMVWDGGIRGSVARGYDNNFRVVCRTVNDDPSRYEYDADGLLLQAGDLAIERDARSGLTLATSLAKITTVTEHSGFGERRLLAARFDNKEIYRVCYERDPLGRIVQLTETIDGQTHTYNYFYDAAGRLIDVSRDGIPVRHYEYDSNGNRVTCTTQDSALTGGYDVQDRLMHYGGVSYRHAPTGELLVAVAAKATTSYRYDVFGKLRFVSLSDGTGIEYLVDGEGRRVGKKVNGNVVQGFLFEDGLRPIAELDGQNRIVSRFVYGTMVNVPDYMKKGGGTYRIITDHRGGPRIIIDVSTGEIVQRVDYDEFGNVLRDTNPGFQPFGFAGGIHDQHTRLTCFGARDFDAHTGRWTSKDPIGFSSGNWNLYAYASNDPINLYDPSGLQDDALSRWLDKKAAGEEQCASEFRQCYDGVNVSMIQSAVGLGTLASARSALPQPDPIAKYVYAGGPWEGGGGWTGCTPGVIRSIGRGAILGAGWAAWKRHAQCVAQYAGCRTGLPDYAPFWSNMGPQGPSSVPIMVSGPTGGMSRTGGLSDQVPPPILY
ncbi:MAG TPA: RHS repeat-associated core domain-containing protein [Gemmatimonadales bacterium]|jgi:RHS repeat-associated protein|nr:RHS repeat-associated core domain-containing protein [Gemmatimonadales bacterium]